MSPQALVKEIKRLEVEMLRRARNLEFEQAAGLRDEIEALKQLELGFPPPRAQAFDNSADCAPLLTIRWTATQSKAIVVAAI